jgi:aryl-alcohol dehydrogenase-like predicted oxidoreductase
VCLSLLDRRATGAMSRLCLRHGVKLLAYGTLGGGFLTRALAGRRRARRGGRLEQDEVQPLHPRDRRLAGALQRRAGGQPDRVARRHGVSMANVATRWVLEQPAVAAVIVGARLGEREHRGDNLRLFAFELDEADRAGLERGLCRHADDSR